MKYDVTLIFSADTTITVDTDTPESAATAAYNSDQAAARLCHHCSSELNLGDVYRAIVYDVDGNEVLDDGMDQQTIKELREQIEAAAQREAALVAALKGAWTDGYCFHGPEGFTKEQQAVHDLLAQYPEVTK